MDSATTFYSIQYFEEIFVLTVVYVDGGNLDFDH